MDEKTIEDLIADGVEGDNEGSCTEGKPSQMATDGTVTKAAKAVLENTQPTDDGDEDDLEAT